METIGKQQATEKVRIQDLQNILFLKPEQEQALVEQALANGNSARLVIHLFYKQEALINSAESIAFQRSLDALLQKSVRMQTPIIFGIPLFFEDQLARYLENGFGYVPENFYFFTTVSDDSLPHSRKFNNMVFRSERSLKVYGKLWKEFAELLLSYGIKNVVLSGLLCELEEVTGMMKDAMLSTKDSDLYRTKQDLLSSPLCGHLLDFWKQREAKGAKNYYYNPRYCVGRAYRYLSSHLNVELSNYAFPDNRKTQRELENPKYP
jgi:hypothetical protein